MFYSKKQQEFLSQNLNIEYQLFVRKAKIQEAAKLRQEAAAKSQKG